MFSLQEKTAQKSPPKNQNVIPETSNISDINPWGRAKEEGTSRPAMGTHR